MDDYDRKEYNKRKKNLFVGVRIILIRNLLSPLHYSDIYLDIKNCLGYDFSNGVLRVMQFHIDQLPRRNLFVVLKLLYDKLATLVII